MIPETTSNIVPFAKKAKIPLSSELREKLRALVYLMADEEAERIVRGDQ